MRVAGAQDLTKRVGLQDVARIVEGNVMDVPLADASVDAVVSQEIILSCPRCEKGGDGSQPYTQDRRSNWPLLTGSPINRFQPQMLN